MSWCHNLEGLQINIYVSLMTKISPTAGLYEPHCEKTGFSGVTAKLICVFVFAYAKSRFSHDAQVMSRFYLLPVSKSSQLKH